ncbi:MAG: penicillin-binding protein 2 [Bacteroidetes bacterium]|nr:MAG: penicillin-binding protein 2 [Bacteroidota bacterium]
MEDNPTRTRIFALLIVAALGILILRLAQLQLIDTEKYAGESRNNAIRVSRVLPGRGSIYDRNGDLMVDNEPAYTLQITPRYFSDENIPLLSELLSLPDSVIQSRVLAAREWSVFRPSTLARGISFDVLARVLELQNVLDGITYEVDQKRQYLGPARASHVLGYVREITRSQLNRRRDENYRPGDLIGQSGIEQHYETMVRGQLGRSLNMVDKRGQIIDSFLDGSENESPTSGLDLHLTIDAELQAFAEELFVNKRGAIVALDPWTGEILVMHSAPDFDLNMFSKPMTDADVEYLFENPEKPMFNRAIQMVQAPGSTFKPLMALLALENGVITENSTVTCNGYHPRGGPGVFRCLAVHGSLAVEDALAKSCNTFFFEMMRRVDVESLNKHAAKFGLGVKPPTDIPGAATGLVPDSAYYDKRYPGWNLGQSMSLGVGQGEIQASPLQLARYVSAIGNGGTLVSPHIVRVARDKETGEHVQLEDRSTSQINIDPRYFELVKKGMSRVISETSYWLQIPGVTMAGKTGTAQNSRGEDDSVFVMFAPIDNPRIAIATLVENAGYGSTTAGPIASLVAELFLNGEIAASRREWVRRIIEDTRSAPITSGRTITQAVQ